MPKCELLITQCGAAPPLPSIKRLFPACGKDAVQQVEVASGDRVYVCQEHFEKLMSREKKVERATKDA